MLVVAGGASAQDQRIHQGHVEVGTLVASDHAPFWLRANQYGTVPLRNPVLRLGAGLRSDYRPADSSGHRRKTDWGYGLDAVVNTGATNQLLLTEAYLKGRLGVFELYAGRRREVVGLVDTLLTTGSYIWSGNALPIPKIQVAVPTFTAVPFTNGVLAFMGTYAHGWFENSGRIVKGSYLHQKQFYLRLGKPTWRVRLFGGANHLVIWAGESDLIPSNFAVNGRLPSSINYYPDVVLGLRNSNAYLNDPNLTSFEVNRIGNHLGTLDVAAEVDLNRWSILGYRQFIFDDGSLFRGTNLVDGLTGLRLKNRRAPGESAFSLRQLTLEYMYTYSQGGDLFIDNAKQRGRDDYFNHSQLVDGWVYYGHTIGTPFLMPYAEVRPTLPGRGGIVNNRLGMIYLGMNALLLRRWELTTRISYSRNVGTYAIPYPGTIEQVSGLISVSRAVAWLGGTRLNAALAFDQGALLPNSVGLSLGLRKTGLLGKRSVKAY